MRLVPLSPLFLHLFLSSLRAPSTLVVTSFSLFRDEDFLGARNYLRKHTHRSLPASRRAGSNTNTVAVATVKETAAVMDDEDEDDAFLYGDDEEEEEEEEEGEEEEEDVVMAEKEEEKEG